MQVRGVSCQGVSDKICRFEESLVEESPIKYAGEQQVQVSSRCRFEESLVEESPIKYAGEQQVRVSSR